MTTESKGSQETVLAESMAVEIVDVEKKPAAEAQVLRGAPKYRWYQTPPSVNRGLFNACGFFYNFAAYVFVSVLSLRCIELGARPFELGIVNGVMAIAGTLGCLAFGSLSDRVSTSIISRVGSALYVVASVLLISAKSLPLTYVASISGGLSEAAFWPSVEGQIGREVDRSNSDASAARFNFFMAAGKAVGCITAGFLFPALGSTKSLLVVIAGNLLVFAIIPFGSRVRSRRQIAIDSDSDNSTVFIELSERYSSDATPRLSTDNSRSSTSTPKPSVDRDLELLPGASEPSSESSTDADDIRRSRLYLPLALIGNCILYGIAGTMSSLYPQFVIDRGLTVGSIGGSAALYGLVIGTLWALQAMAFAILSIKTIPWQYHRWLLYLLEAFAVAATALLSFVAAGWVALVLAAVVGACIGFSSMSSLAYSLRASENSKGAFAGIHEALVQIGTSVMPIASGFLASGTGEDRSPYWLCAALIAVAIFTQELAFRDKRRIQQRELEVKTMNMAAWLRRHSSSIPSVSSSLDHHQSSLQPSVPTS